MSAEMTTVNGNVKATGTKDIGNREISVPDTLLAVWLGTNGFRPTRITGSGNRKFFIFENVPEQLLRTYQLGDARVEPMKFGSLYRALLRMLHQEPSTV
jgi:hypothetical protein